MTCTCVNMCVCWFMFFVLESPRRPHGKISPLSVGEPSMAPLTSHTTYLKIGISVTNPPDTQRYRVSATIGWLDVCIP